MFAVLRILCYAHMLVMDISIYISILSIFLQAYISCTSLSQLDNLVR